MESYSRRERRTIISVLELTALVFLVGIAFAAPMLPARAAQQWTIDATSSFTFSPVIRPINVGDYLVWHNAAGFTHNVTANATDPVVFPGFDIPSGGNSHPVWFNVTGVYDYYCSLHTSYHMWGRITVSPVVPEFSGSVAVAAGLLVMALGLMFARRKT